MGLVEREAGGWADPGSSERTVKGKVGVGVSLRPLYPVPTVTDRTAAYERNPTEPTTKTDVHPRPKRVSRTPGGPRGTVDGNGPGAHPRDSRRVQCTLEGPPRRVPTHRRESNVDAPVPFPRPAVDERPVSTPTPKDSPNPRVPRTPETTRGYAPAARLGKDPGSGWFLGGPLPVPSPVPFGVLPEHPEVPWRSGRRTRDPRGTGEGGRSWTRTPRRDPEPDVKRCLGNPPSSPNPVGRVQQSPPVSTPWRDPWAPKVPSGGVWTVEGVVSEVLLGPEVSTSRDGTSWGKGRESKEREEKEDGKE